MAAAAAALVVVVVEGGTGGGCDDDDDDDDGSMTSMENGRGWRYDSSCSRLLLLQETTDSLLLGLVDDDGDGGLCRWRWMTCLYEYGHNDIPQQHIGKKSVRQRKHKQRKAVHFFTASSSKGQERGR